MSIGRQNTVLRAYFCGRKAADGLSFLQAPAWTASPVALPNTGIDLSSPPSYNRLTPWTELEVRGGEDPLVAGTRVEGVGFLGWAIHGRYSDQRVPGAINNQVQWEWDARLTFELSVPRYRGEGLLEEQAEVLESLWRGFEFYEADMYLRAGTGEHGPRMVAAAATDEWWKGVVQVWIHREETVTKVGRVAVNV